MLQAHGARPWRFGHADYLAAVQRLSPMARGHRLGADVVDAPWDTDLTAVMQAHDCAVAEEALVDVLLDDLRIRARVGAASRDDSVHSPP